MEEVAKLATRTDPFLACCLCGQLLRDAVQLTCLHCCCQSCYSEAASTSESGNVACSSCGDVTQAGAQHPNSFIAQQVERYLAIAESRMCGACKENGEPEKPALVWCSACKHSLCGDCLPLHKRFRAKHVTQSLEELTSLDGVCPQSSADVCSAHKKPLEIACMNCEQAKCFSCWADCKKKKHKVHFSGDDLFESYVDKFIAFISSEESNLFQKAGVLEKPRSLMQELKAARADHLEQINQRKRRIMDAVDVAYQQIECVTKNLYDDLENKVSDASVVVERIALNLSDARNYIRRLFELNSKCVMFNQQRIVRQRLKVLSGDIDAVRKTLDEMQIVIVDSSLPENLEAILKAWIGTPLMHADQWSLINPKGKKHYAREFLLTFQHAKQSLERPEGLPDLNDIIVDKSFGTSVFPEQGRRATGNPNSGGDYYFTPGYVKAGPAPRAKRGWSQNPSRNHE